MRKFCLFFILLAGPLFSVEIQKEQLKHWIDTKKEMIIIDARPVEYDDGERLPGAILIPYDTSEQELLSTLPKKDSVIVVYCTGPNCKASLFLAKALQKLGYKNIHEFRGGLEEWEKASYPIQKVAISSS